MRSLNNLPAQTPTMLTIEKLQSEIKKHGLNSTIEADHYLQSLERYGIICYKKLGDPVHNHAFAWQIVEDSKTFMRFDKKDRHYIELLAIRERQDDWYRLAGHLLQNFGFEKFTDSSFNF